MGIKANITTNKIEVAAVGRQGVQGIEGPIGPQGPVGSLDDQLQMVYVSKIGNDSNSGLNIGLAKLTVGAAITAASGMTPSESNQVTIQIIDAGDYQENPVLPEWVHIFGPNAGIDGLLEVSNNCIVDVRRLQNSVSSTQCVKKADSGGLSKVTAAIMIVATNQEGVRCFAGQIGLDVGTMVLNGAEGLVAQNGSRITFNIQFVSMSNNSDFLKTNLAGVTSNSFFGEVLRVEDDNTSRFLVANAIGDKIDVQAGSVAVLDLYTLGTDTVLNLYASTTAGTRTDGTNSQANIMDLAGDSNLQGDLNVEGALTSPAITELQKPSITVIPVFSTDDLPAAVAGIIELTTNDVRYQIYCLVDIGTDRILSSAARIQIEGMTPDAGFLYTGTGILLSTDSTVQLANINLIGMTATALINAANSGLNTLLCRSLGLIGGTSTDLVCIDNYDNVLFELCGFVSGNRGICLFNNVTNFTLLLCQFQIGVVGINIDFGTSLCAAIAIETCVSELSATSTFINAATDNGNITTNGGGTITHNKVDDSEVGSVISVGLSALDLRWTILGNNNLVASDRLNPTGWAFYQDGDTVVQTAVAGEGSAIQFSVDGLGVNSNSDFAPRVIRGSSEMWDTSTNEFIPITEGDSFNARIAFTLTAKGANPDLLTVVFDIGGAAGITIPIYATSISTPNSFPQTITLNAPVFALATFLANNGRIFMYTDSGTLDVEARAILIQRVSSGAS